MDALTPNALYVECPRCGIDGRPHTSIYPRKQIVFPVSCHSCGKIIYLNKAEMIDKYKHVKFLHEEEKC